MESKIMSMMSASGSNCVKS